MSETETETPTEPQIRYCTLVPIGGQIIVKRDPPKEMTKGGILMPEVHKASQAKKIKTGVVIRKGPGFIHPGTGQHVTVSEDIQPGTRVVMGEYAGTDYEHEEAHGREVYTVMQEAEVLCILGGEVERRVIPDIATTQADLDVANKALAERNKEIAKEMQKRSEELTKEMLNHAQGRSKGGLRLPGGGRR
jgi:co-chaperonin GroES (HSP10)